MKAVNVVRLRAKPEYEADVIQFHRDIKDTFPGMLRYSFIKTGERTYCWIGEWDNYDSIINARPLLVMTLDRMRPMLEDLGEGRGITDPVSGEALFITELVPETAPGKKPKAIKTTAQKSKTAKTTKSKAEKTTKAKVKK
jgi:hypothetical protein